MTDTPTLDIARAVEEVLHVHRADAPLHIAAAMVCAVDPDKDWKLLDPAPMDLYKAIELRKPRTEPLADPDTISNMF